ncbi:MAG: NUDIX domain-containing protein [Nanoarchaeota archaeon]
MEDEQLDIVDEHDNVIEQGSRNDIYQKRLPNNQSIRVINILVFNHQGQLLLPQRSANRKLFPNRYDFSCGEHVQIGESYDQAARRGLREELGIDGLPIYVGKLTPKEVSSFMQVYILVHDGPFRYDREGIQQLRWVNKQELQEILHHPEQCKNDLPIVYQWYLQQPGCLLR